MGQSAERVYTSQGDIDRIEALAAQLDGETHVSLVLEDDSRIDGVVAVRPIVQTFLDPEGREGINAVVRVDDAADNSVIHWIWLDRVRELRRHGSS